MNKYFIALAALLLCTQARAESQPASGRDAAARANTISVSFHRKVSAKPGNIFFSPYSLYSAFAMAYDGARGTTAAEMRKVFGFPDDRNALRREFGIMRGELAKSAGSTEFSQANALWYQKDHNFLKDYTAALENFYSASAEAADFKQNPELVRRTVNSWAAGRTKGRIPEIFAHGALTNDTKLVLANAVYFKGKWKAQFGKKDTTDQDFTLLSGRKIKASLMASPGAIAIKYYENEQFQAAALPYAGGDMDMLVILPKPGKSFSLVEKNLSAEMISAVRAGLRGKNAKVFLPRLQFSREWDLGPELSAMGMPQAFDDSADFSGMNGKKELIIQKAVQKAFVEINEEGTEAAAVTAIAMMPGSARMQDPVVFRADRPFIFLIEDSRTGLILFMGRMVAPPQ